MYTYVIGFVKYVHMHVCMYVRMLRMSLLCAICTYVRTYIPTYVRTYIRIQLRICVRSVCSMCATHKRTYVCTYVHNVCYMWCSHSVLRSAVSASPVAECTGELLTALWIDLVLQHMLHAISSLHL